MVLSQLRAALRIVGDTAVYRIRAREANNLLTSISLMVALGLPWADLLYRSGFAAVLNLYLYLMNDYCDIDRDLSSPAKDRTKARFMAEHRAAALGSLVALGGLLLGTGLAHSRLLAGAMVLNTLLVLSYSAWLKRTPLLDVVAMTATGVAVSLVALPEGRLAGWKLAGVLGLVCASFEVIQVIRDEPDDRRAGVTTTAVILGARGAAWLFRAIVVGSVAYVVLVVGSLVGLVLLPAVLLPLTPERASRTWDLCRLLFGGVWAALLVQVYVGQI